MTDVPRDPDNEPDPNLDFAEPPPEMPGQNEGAPKPSRRRKPKARGGGRARRHDAVVGGKGSFNQKAAVFGVIAIVGIVVALVFASQAKNTTYIDQVISITGGGVREEIITVEGFVPYTFQVKPINGSVRVGVGGIEGTRPTREEIRRAMQSVEDVPQGKQYVLDSTMSSGTFLFFIVNPDPGQTVRAHVFIEGR